MSPPDPRGVQSGSSPSPTINGIKAIELNVKSEDDLKGIKRFYENTFQTESQITPNENGENVLEVPFGPHQSLNFKVGPITSNSDYVDGTGPHISLYVNDLEDVWKRG